MGPHFYAGILTRQSAISSKYDALPSYISSSATQTCLTRRMLLFMHIALLNAKDHYMWRAVLATSFRNILSEERKLLPM